MIHLKQRQMTDIFPYLWLLIRTICDTLRIFVNCTVFICEKRHLDFLFENPDAYRWVHDNIRFRFFGENKLRLR